MSHSECITSELFWVCLTCTPNYPNELYILSRKVRVLSKKIPSVFLFLFFIRSLLFSLWVVPLDIWNPIVKWDRIFVSLAGRLQNSPWSDLPTSGLDSQPQQPLKDMQGKRRLALWPSACEKPTPDSILWCLWNVLREEHCDTEVSSHRFHQDIIPTKTFRSGLPSQGTCETDQRSLCIRELIIFVCFPLQCIPKNVWVSKPKCLWECMHLCLSWFPESISFHQSSDWLSVVFYTLLRKGESLWPWLDLGHLVSFNLLSIPLVQYLSFPPPKKNESNFFL